MNKLLALTFIFDKKRRRLCAFWQKMEFFNHIFITNYRKFPLEFYVPLAVGMAKIPC